MDSKIRSYNTWQQYTCGFFFIYFTIFKDYVTGLEVLARLLYYLFQGRVVVSSHSSFIHSLYRGISTKCIQNNTCLLSLLLEIHFI